MKLPSLETFPLKLTVLILLVYIGPVPASGLVEEPQLIVGQFYKQHT